MSDTNSGAQAMASRDPSPHTADWEGSPISIYEPLAGAR
jgi:hypothetical protein